VLPEPTLVQRIVGEWHFPMLVWRLSAPALAISTGPLGGGIGERRWVINAGVPVAYDLADPADHLGEMAYGLGLAGPGVGLLTAIDVAGFVAVGDGGVRLWATVGLTAPILAFDPASVPAAITQAAAERQPDSVSRPGTINVVAWVPRRLSDGALVNMVATVTEAKAQALRDLGLDATGTATDGVCVLCPPHGPEAEYGGPRSLWGEPLARTAYQAVRDGGRAFIGT